MIQTTNIPPNRKQAPSRQRVGAGVSVSIPKHMDTREKYKLALMDMTISRSFSLHDICHKHHISCTVGTIIRQLGWVNHKKGSRKWTWVGPHPISDAEIDTFLTFVREYKRETRKGAPSMVPGARQERREREEKHQGRRTDLHKNTGSKTFSLFWGLVRFSY